MHAFAAPRTHQLRVLIIDVIIGEMMFHPDDTDGTTRARLLESFVPTLDSSEDAADAGDVSRYAVPSPTPSRFSWLHNFWLLDYRSVRFHK
jgi:hypothetical protein